MHKEILNTDQIELLALVKEYKREFYLVGGTAIALHIGHRRSIDFDLFKNGIIRHKTIISKIEKSKFKYQITRRVNEQLNVNINNVKFTFFDYPYEIEHNVQFENKIKLPDLLTLAAMKAFALGPRSKWKDYVDLYFILKNYHAFSEICKKSNEIYNDLFSEKLFRAQLAYFEDINYSEPVEFVVPEVSESEIKEYLTEIALMPF
ncbi:MAG: hypothetical protein A2033_16350 [Bacteroidetes bacterium GWA2_31_9]|nr:MAG: hypothetical protein A2033_16350 [Bacteroidetes bacterium GWA2_31_9]